MLLNVLAKNALSLLLNFAGATLDYRSPLWGLNVISFNSVRRTSLRGLRTEHLPKEALE